ncbi:aminotransferase class V-fold PLP-dependent enzyme [Flammeovirgaceae bacterium SG7u.111]|nr:aminotransferase class V-fold PLP-dependent enzyme [Flammeovirgaceae bacterium SG7u.132]WPO38532.1 aminotransferase class V-fold PLP-dependent enzyme [Flammeovirgaceae bacterium SG7u.111]
MLTCQKELFDLPEEVTYLNASYMSPLLKSAAEEGIKGLNKKLRPFEIYPKDFFEHAALVKKEFAQLINTPEPDRIALIPAVSYGMAVVANNLPLKEGQNIVVVGEQFPSNVYPWRALASDKGASIRTVCAPSSTEKRGLLWNEQLLEAIDEQTALVAIAPLHWADGTLFDLMAIRKKTKDVGAWMAIDGTQSVGALPIDVSELQPEALVCSGYKWLLGSYGSGLAYFSKILDNGKPIEEGWIGRKDSENFSGLLNYKDNYLPAANRYEMGGRSNFISLPIQLESLRQLNKWGVENIQAYCKAISEKAIERMKNAGLIIEKDCLAYHLFGVRLPEGMDLEKVKEALQEKQVFVSYRGNSIRVSPHLYNTEEQLKLFVDTILNKS